MDQLCIWLQKKKELLWRSTPNLANQQKKKNPKGGVGMQNLFFTFSIPISSPSALELEGLHFKSKAMILQILIDGPLIWFYGLLFTLKWHQALLLLLPDSKNLNDSSCCWHSGSFADIRDQIGQIWLIGAQNLEPLGLHVCEEECNSSFASIYRGEKIQLVRNNSPRRWQCPLSGILAETCLRG